MSLLRSIDAAAERLRGRVRETPVEPSAVLSEASGCRVHLKLENFQLTGSFKLRGALNKLLCLSAEQRARGVIAASSGNHGAGVARAAAALGCPATVFVPEATSDAKVHGIASAGAEVIRFGSDCVHTEAHARRVAEERGRVYVSPYNDLDVVAGQATVGVELLRQLEDFAAVFVALGGGGLISGIGTYLKSRLQSRLKSRGRGIDVVACSPASSPVMHRSLAAGRIVEMETLPTLSDATAGGVEPGAVTFDLCRAAVDDSVVVSEADIAAALRTVVAHHHCLIEGAAAVAVAGFLLRAQRYAGKDVAIVLCGANIGVDVLARVLAAPEPR
jgi:threonine dehydratase